MQRQLMLQPVNSNSMTTKEPSIQVKKECILFSQSVMNGYVDSKYLNKISLLINTNKILDCKRQFVRFLTVGRPPQTLPRPTCHRQVLTGPNQEFCRKREEISSMPKSESCRIFFL